MNKNDAEQIIKRIKNRRLQLGYSYQDLADRTGISKSTLQRYETGEITRLPVNKLEDLAKALEVSPGYLMGWIDSVEDASLNFKSISTAEEAMKFILKQPVLIAYGGYDIKKMSDKDLIDFANGLLSQLELISLKYGSKRR